MTEKVNEKRHLEQYQFDKEEQLYLVKTRDRWDCKGAGGRGQVYKLFMRLE